jgi:hypothetical protein
MRDVSAPAWVSLLSMEPGVNTPVNLKKRVILEFIVERICIGD